MSDLSDDEIIALLTESRTLARTTDGHRDVARAQRKRGVLAGLHGKAWTDSLRDMKKPDPEALITYLRERIRYNVLMRQQITAKDLEDLFGGLLPVHVAATTIHAQDLWDAENGGMDAGYRGIGLSDCPYEPGSEMHAEWSSAWHKGAAQRAYVLGPAGEQAVATRGQLRRLRQLRIEGTEKRGPKPKLTAVN